MKRPLFAITLVGVLTAVGAATPLARADDSTIALEGRGAKREALAAMQYKPFDAALWAKLKDWSNGQALSPENYKGKPVLIAAWAGWLKGSHIATTMAQDLADKYGSMGLDVVLVHSNRSPDQGKKILDDAKIKVRSAVDEKGEFFNGLKIEGGGPDFYLIDRSGNLRFAQIDRKSVAAAVEMIVKETPDEAAKASAPAAKSGGSGGAGTDPAADGSTWTKPAASAYAAAKWPKANPSPGAKNMQGKALDLSWGAATWVTEKPQLEGKVLVLDFWATWCGPCVAASPGLDALQKANKESLVIVGMSGMARPPTKPEDPKAIKAYLVKKPSEYSHANDLKLTVANRLGVQGIPHVVVLSTDGIVRWQGHPASDEFKAAVEDTIKVDPGVKAKKSGKDAPK